MAEEHAEIREGFLCPVCKEDLGTILNLHSHFAEEHKEDKDVLSAVKGFFGKAKTIFSEVSTEPGVSSKKNDIPETRSFFQEQKIGTTRNLTADFKAARDCKVNYRVTKTNQLLVRLDRLISDLPFEPSKRKAHEQNVVQWASDEDVKMCPECARSFGILRRRHHCRLCGSIQCHECSSFILVSRARKLIYPAQGSPEPVRKVSPGGAKNGIRLKLPSSSASVASITSFADVETGEPHFRVCKYCLDLIDHHEWQVDARNNRPAIVVLYDSLISNKQKAVDLVSKYINISRSLWEGETMYLLSDAQNLRLELLKLADTLDSLSKRIASLGKDHESPLAGSQLSLQNKVRYGTAQFLKDNLLGLPSLPTEAELEEVRERKRLEALRRLEMQKERVTPRTDSQESIRRVYSTPRMSSPEPVSHELGWTANSSKAREDLDGTDHPLVEQMHMLRNYIKEARLQHRYDEVATLQENLKELEAEYSKLSTSDASLF